MLQERVYDKSTKSYLRQKFKQRTQELWCFKWEKVWWCCREFVEQLGLGQEGERKTETKYC